MVLAAVTTVDIDDRQTETRDLLFHTLGVLKHRENAKVTIRGMDPITSLFTLGR